MKKTLLPLLLSSLLFADCMPHEEQEANQLWKQSRDMQHSIQKFQQLQQAKRLCSTNAIKVDIQLFMIANELADQISSIKTIRKLQKLIDEARSQNIMILNGKIQSQNAQNIKELQDRLVEIQLNRNQGQLDKLQAYDANSGTDKALGNGEEVLIPIRFANGKDQVIGNKNIDTLVRRIKHTLTTNKHAEFTITGYASSVGKASSNQGLSERRGNNTKRYIEQYIPKGKIITFGEGESDLICNNGGYAKNMGGEEYKCQGGSENEASSRRIVVLRRK